MAANRLGGGELTRRLYRSSEGEYLINSTRTRLRDLVDLVREGGLTADGHIIVGQGLVDEVLSLKGSERRAYVGAVAGVAPYEARRAESLRRLEQTRENLAAAQIILSELEPRLRLLRRQANIAQNAMSAKADLAQALTWHYAREWSRLNTLRKTAVDSLASCEAEVSQTREAVARIEAERSRAHEENEAARRQRHAAREALLEAQYRARQTKDAHEAARDRLERVDRDLRQLRHTASELDGPSGSPAGNDGSNARLETLRDERDQLLARLAEARDQARLSQAEVQAQGDRRSQAQSLLAEVKTRLTKAESIAAGLETEQSSLATQVSQAETRLPDLREEIQAAELALQEGLRDIRVRRSRPRWQRSHCRTGGRDARRGSSAFGRCPKTT